METRKRPRLLMPEKFLASGGRDDPRFDIPLEPISDRNRLARARKHQEER